MSNFDTSVSFVSGDCLNMSLLYHRLWAEKSNHVVLDKDGVEPTRACFDGGSLCVGLAWNPFEKIELRNLVRKKSSCSPVLIVPNYSAERENGWGSAGVILASLLHAILAI